MATGNVSESQRLASSRSIRGRLAGMTQAERRAMTARARAARDEQFLAQVDPTGTLDPQARAQRLAEAKRDHMVAMARRAAESRRARAEAARAARLAELAQLAENIGRAMKAELRVLISDAVAAAPPVTAAQIEELRRLVVPAPAGRQSPTRDPK